MSLLGPSHPGAIEGQRRSTKDCIKKQPDANPIQGDVIVTLYQALAPVLGLMACTLRRRDINTRLNAGATDDLSHANEAAIKASRKLTVTNFIDNNDICMSVAQHQVMFLMVRL